MLHKLIENAQAMITEADRQLSIGKIDAETRRRIIRASRKQIDRLRLMAGVPAPEENESEDQADWEGEASLRDAESGMAQARRDSYRAQDEQDFEDRQRGYRR